MPANSRDSIQSVGRHDCWAAHSLCVCMLQPGRHDCKGFPILGDLYSIAGTWQCCFVLVPGRKGQERHDTEDCKGEEMQLHETFRQLHISS